MAKIQAIADVLLEQAKTQNHQVVELACYLSLAVRIEPALLRRIRLVFLPQSEPGIEADLWFSPLVQSRSQRSIMLRADVLPLLRKELLALETPDKQSKKPLDYAWELLQASHRNAPPTLQLEERVTYLALSERPDAKEEIEKMLQTVVAAMTQEARAESLARWAARALPQLPSLARKADSVAVLALGAGARLGNRQVLDVPFPDPKVRGWLPQILPDDLERVQVGVRLLNQAVEFCDPVMEGSHTLDVPKTHPVLLEVYWNGGVSTSVQWTPGQIQRIRVELEPIIIRTLLGTTYTLRIQQPTLFQTSSADSEKDIQGDVAILDRRINVQKIRLSTHEKTNLVSLLLDCPSIKDRESREKILKLLPDKIMMAIPRSIIDLTDIFNIVTTCMSFSGGIQELISAVHYFEHDSLPMQALDKFIRDNVLFSQIISSRQFTELLKISSRITLSYNNLKRIYTASAPQDWARLPRTDNEADALIAALGQLADAPIQSDGTVPLLKFVGLLSLYVSENQVQDELRTWINATARELGIVVPSPTKAIGLDEIYAYPYLLIKIQPDHFDQNLFFYQAWLIYNTDIENIYTDNIRHPLEDLPELLGSLLKDVGGKLEVVMNELTIEFISPFNLLYYGFDQLPIYGRYSQSSLGSEYRVVVRSYDRLYSNSNEIQRYWKRNWNKLLEQSSSKFDAKLFEQSSSESTVNQLSPSVLIHPVQFISNMDAWDSQIMFERLISNETGGVVLTFVPPISLRQAIFSTMLRAGITIILYLRELNVSVEEAQVVFQSLLSKTAFMDLPSLVQNMRREAVESRDERHLGHHIALLWDDPNRLPPDLDTRFTQFQSPMSRL